MIRKLITKKKHLCFWEIVSFTVLGMSSAAILLILFIGTVSSERIRYLKLTKISCRDGKTYTDIGVCKLTPINRYVAYINFEGPLLKDLKNIFVKGQLYKQDYTIDFKPFLINVSMSICRIMDRSETNYFGTIIWNEFKRSTNLDTSKGCPLRATYVQATNFSLVPSLLDKFPVPLGNYKLVMDFYEKVKNKLEQIFGMDMYMTAGSYINKVRS